jgi:hypothetical protein
MRALAAAALFVTIVATQATADTMQFGASKDNTLYQDQPNTSNGAGQHFFAGQAGTVNPIRRGLLAFDVSAIPAGSTINSVTLTLNMSRTAAGVEPVSLHRVLSDWGEGTSAGTMGEGSGAPATAGDATWQYTFFNTTPWATNGGDFVPIASATQNIGNVGIYVFPSTVDLVADVQHWADNPGLNYGWVFLGDEIGAQPTSKRFDSKDNSITSNRPVLEVDFTPPTVGVEGSPPVARILELLPVTPNPVFAAATFRFRLAEASHVRLNVFDVRGRRVTDWSAGRYPAGESVVRWNAAEMPPGTYWVRIETQGASEARRFVLAELP